MDKITPTTLTIQDIENAYKAAMDNFGAPDIVMFYDEQSAKAFMKRIDPTRGMNKREVRLYKLLYE